MGDQIKKEFEKFITDLEKRLREVGLDLQNFVIDHACYRTKNLSDFEKYKEVFTNLSNAYTETFFHERNFTVFLLREPLRYGNLSICCIEFAEPGGSDDYETGFQHIELLTNLEMGELSSEKEKIQKLVYEARNGEIYLKWKDKIALKVTGMPLFYKSIVVEKANVVNNF